MAAALDRLTPQRGQRGRAPKATLAQPGHSGAPELAAPQARQNVGTTDMAANCPSIARQLPKTGWEIMMAASCLRRGAFEPAKANLTMSQVDSSQTQQATSHTVSGDHPDDGAQESALELRRLQAALQHDKRRAVPFLASLATQGLAERLDPIRLPAAAGARAVLLSLAWPSDCLPPLLCQRVARVDALAIDLSAIHGRQTPGPTRAAPWITWPLPWRKKAADVGQAAPLAEVNSIASHAALPLPNASVDVLIAHLVPAFIGAVRHCVDEWARVLKPGGLVMLAALGPDTGREWDAQLPWGIDRSKLIDLHDWGDALVAAGFGDPVLDVDRQVLRYRDIGAALREWAAHLPTRPLYPGLGRRSLERFARRSAAPSAGFDVTVELTFGHAFKPMTSRRMVGESSTVTIDAELLRTQLRARRSG